MPTKRSASRLSNISYVVKNLGFEYLNALTRPKDRLEPPKAVYDKSFWIALSRCSIHIVPLAVFAFIIFLNYYRIYIGPGLITGQPDSFVLALFQVVAKALEIFTGGSLAVIVFFVLRRELLGEGIPLGLAVSGLLFGQPNYFWSPEFLANVTRDPRKKDTWRIWRLLFVTSVCGLIVLTIAPASAILLQPREQFMPGGGTEYFFSASPDQLWPSTVDGSDAPDTCLSENATRLAICPSGGFNSLRSYFRNFNTDFQIPESLRDLTDINTPSDSAPAIVRSYLGLTAPIRNVGSSRIISVETIKSQPHVLSATIQSNLMAEWRRIVKTPMIYQNRRARQFRFATRTATKVTSTSPLVRVFCAPAQTLNDGPTDLQFPIKTSSHPNPTELGWDGTATFRADIPSINNTRYPVTRWVDLPIERFGPVSGGIIVHLPSRAADNTQIVIPCSISAAWFSSNIDADSTVSEGAWHFTEEHGSLGQIDETWPITSDIATNTNATLPNDAPKVHRLIRIDESWYEKLTPTVTCEDCIDGNATLNTIELLLRDGGFSEILTELRTQTQMVFDGQQCVPGPPPPGLSDLDRWNDLSCGKGGKVIFIESILAATFADGLARYGLRHAFTPESLSDNPFSPELWANSTLPLGPTYEESLAGIRGRRRQNAIAMPSEDVENVTRVQMEISVFGWSYSTTGIADHLAAAVIACYMLVATLHVIWVLTRARCTTSAAWEGPTELLALALTSPKPEPRQRDPAGLSSVGAGIEQMDTYRKFVRIRAADGIQSNDEGQVEESSGRVVMLVGRDVDCAQPSNRSNVVVKRDGASQQLGREGGSQDVILDNEQSQSFLNSTEKPEMPASAANGDKNPTAGSLTIIREDEEASLRSKEEYYVKILVDKKYL